MSVVESMVEKPLSEADARSIISCMRARLGMLLVSHAAVDTYSAFVSPMVLLLEVRCSLRPSQTAVLLGLGSLTSGLSQPIAAWLSDRFDSRIFAPIGLIIAAICLSCIGLANNFQTLALLYMTGMLGVGIFHPIGASSAGHLSELMRAERRSAGISYFFVAGMAGGILGSLLAPWIVARDGGFTLLRYLLIPGVVIGVMLLIAIRRVPHRDRVFHDTTVSDSISARWRMVAILYISNALRFTVNTALVYLFVRWAQTITQRNDPALVDRAVAVAASPMVGHLNALVMIGMAVGGLSAGSLVRAGREKLPMIIIPLLAAPLVAILPIAGLWAGYILTAMIGFGFAATNPLSISLSQRLLPHRTSLASSLMMGAAWAVAMVGPLLAEMILQSRAGLTGAFIFVAAMLAISGMLCALLNQNLLQQAARRRMG